MTRRIKHIHKYAATIAMIATLILAASSCSPTFDDESKSILMKPEIISIALDPPEAAPGEAVTASFLAADQYGAITEAPVQGALLQVWMLAEPGASAFASGAVGNGSLDSGQGDGTSDGTDANAPDMANIGIMPSFNFETYSSSEYTFNEDGLSPQLLTLLFFPQGVDPAGLKSENLSSDIQKMIESGQAQLALRTLVVSARSDKNRNPRITGATVAVGDTTPAEIVFLGSNSENITTARALAAANPFEVKYRKNLRLHIDITVEDEGDPEDTLLYQWISNGGEFRGLPTEERDWLAPEYIEPGEGFSDQSGQETVDPRTDPNLHPIWIIVRDNGVDNQFGQSWVEFYVRVKK